MTVTDRVRIATTVARYDFWLDFRGVPAARRRDLRRELSANLTEAAQAHGTTAALLGVGSPKALAYAVSEAFGGRPRWALGGYLALAAGLALQTTWFFSVAGFVDGVEASGVTGRTVTGQVSPWGSEVSATFGADGQSTTLGATFPLALWAVALLVGLVAAQPWRPFTHRRGAEVAQHA